MEFEITPTPEEFAELMKQAQSSDYEGAHCDMDNLMASLLRKLGYEKAIDIFDNQRKWYA